MRKTKFLLAIFIVIAMIMSNCISIFKNMVFADGEIAIHFDTNTYTDKTATFKVGEENVTITISGTESTIHEDGDNCGIGFTEPLGSEVTIQVSDNFNQETMEIGAAGNDGFYHELTVDQNRFVIFSGTETDDMTGELHNWGVPMDFHFGIVERGLNSGPQQGNNGMTIQFDINPEDVATATTATTAIFDVDGVKVAATVLGEGLAIETDGNGARLEIPESLLNGFNLQVSENYNPETMEIYAANGGEGNGFTEVLQIDENRHVIFTESVIAQGGFHFGIVPKGFTPVNTVTITIDPNGGIPLDGFEEKIEDVPTGEEFVITEVEACLKAPACHEFEGWVIGGNFYAKGEAISFSESTTIISRWKEIPHTSKTVKENEVKSTCSKEGSYDEVIYCSECNKVISRVKKTTAKTAHTPKEVVTTKVTKATLSKDGQIVKSIENKCTECGEIVGGRGETVTIPYPKTISLSKTSFTYNSKVQKPTVTVKGSDGKAIDASNYTITYSNKNSKKVGEYKATIKFKGNYEGTKTLTYKIVPKGTSLNKLTTGKKQFKATWKAQKTETSGYEVQYSTNKNFKSGNKTAKITKNKTTSNTVKKLKAKKKYYVRIRTYKTVNGKKIYSDWSKSKSVKTKK